MIWKMLPRKMWLFSLFLVTGLGVIFYLVLGRGVESNTTQQLLRRETALARAEAANLTTSFRLFGNSVSLRSKLNSMEKQDATTLSDLDAFVKEWSKSGLIGGVILTDDKGTIQFNSNVLGTKDVGASVADRDYFIWAKNQTEDGGYFIGQQVASRAGASKGQVIIPVASPVFENDKFEGVVAVSVELQPLTEHFLELMKISDETRVYLISEKGEVLYNSFDRSTVGLNVFEPAPNRPFWGNRPLVDGLKEAINASQEGKLKAPYLNTKTQKMEEHLVAYSPVILGDRNWMVIMASPVENVTKVTTPIYIKQTAIMLLIYITVLLFGLIVNRESKRQSGLQK